MTSDEAILEAWASCVAFAWNLAKADRSRELRGDRSVKAFDARGLHPYSVEWGRILTYESMLPELADVRACSHPPLDWITMRRMAARDAERDFAEQVRAGGADAFA